MKDFLKKFYPFIILAILAFTLHFAFLSYPSQTVFDEVHFGKFVSAYFSHQYYFDIHPPLGKLMIAGWVKLMNFSPNFDFDHIGEAAAPKLFFTLRFLPALFGSIFVLLFSYFAWLVSRSKKTALIAGFLILLDNAFLVQSRLIAIDIFLLFFEISALCFFLLYQREKGFSPKWLGFLALAGISFGLAVSIKWTGLAVLGIITALLLAKIFIPSFAAWFTPSESAEKKNYLKYAKEAAASFAIMVFVGFAIYAIPFAIHFKLLPKSGVGDAFMSARFQNELRYGKQNAVAPLSFWQKFQELNITMFKASAGLTATHPFGSRWYEWPLDKKPVYYWVQDSADATHKEISKIYFLGNPVIWFLALIFAAITLLKTLIKKERQKMKPVYYFLAIAFFANLLPFIFVKRVSFLYHYLPSVSFAILLFSIYLRELWTKEKIVFWAALAAIILGFIILAPLSYGWPMTPALDRFEMKIIDFLS